MTPSTKFLTCLFAIMLGGLCALAQSTPKESATCSATSFVGDVKLGLPFTQVIGSGLTYRLLPSAVKSSSPTEKPVFTGWTIQVVYLEKRGDMEREFSELVTPPYRESGPRDVDAIGGSDRQNDRTINFVTTTLDYAEANKVLRPIMWRSSPQEIREAALELPHIPIGTAKMTILRQQLAPDSKKIQALSFKVDVYVPTGVKLTPELASHARTVSCPAPKLAEMFREMQQ